MTKQLDIFAAPSDLDEAFHKYNADNPQILNKLIEMADEAKRAGVKRIGIKGMWEALRWDTTIKGNDDYKLNNSYTSRYVRLISEQRPDLGKLFQVRKIRS